MPGSRARRIAVGTAVWTMATLSGCHGIAMNRWTGPPPIPNRPQSALGAMGRTAIMPATQALENPSEIAAIDPINSATGTITRTSALSTGGKATLIATDPTAAADPGQPTPLLDAALVQARNRGELPTEPPPEPPPEPKLAAPAASPPVPAPEPVTIPSPPAPVLTSAPSPEPKPTEVAPPVVSPEEQWRDGIHKLVGLARSKQEQGGPSGLEPWELRTRVLAWLAEPDIDPDLSGRETDGVRSVLHALEATTTAGNPRAGADSRLRANDIRTAIRTLEARAPLELVDLQICQEVRAFGDFVPFDPPARHAGDWVVLYCEVEGLHQEPTSGGYQTRLAGRLEISAEGGGPTVIVPLDTAEETPRCRRRDYFVGYRKYLPASLTPGRYTARVILTDVFNDRTASRSVPLVIVRDKESGAPAPHEATRNP